MDTQAVVVRIDHILLHKGDMNNVLPTIIAYRSVPRFRYCVPYSAMCIVIHWCTGVLFQP